jgi:hypothetical protein
VDEETTTTTEVPRVVGEHPGAEAVLLPGLAVFVVIMVAGTWATRRNRRAEAARQAVGPKTGGG